jgi:hypothetical protein
MIDKIIANYSKLIIDLASLIEQGRKTAVRYVNTVLVATYRIPGEKAPDFNLGDESLCSLFLNMLKYS